MFKREDKKTGVEVVGFIGKGMAFEGKLSFEDTVRIDGSFKGEVSATGTLVVGDTGYIEGQIKIGTAIITGEVKGSLDAAVRVELKAPARIFGDIRTPNLIIGEGVVFEGNCIMVKKGPPPHAALPQTVDYGESEQAGRF